MILSREFIHRLHLLYEHKNNATTGFVIIDYDFNYLLLNTAAENFFGKKPEELIGKNARDVFPDQWDFGPFKIGQKAVAEKQPFEISYRSPFAKKWVELKGIPHDKYYIFEYHLIAQKEHLESELRKEMRRNKTD